MRICFLANAGSIHTYRWVRFFSQKGHAVFLISLKPPAFSYPGITIFQIKKISLRPRILAHLINFFPAYIQLKKILKGIHFDILHVIGAAGEGWLGVFTGFHPFVVTIGGTDVLINPKLFKGYELLTRQVLKKADILTCDGRNGEEAMIALGADPQKIRVIHFGVDVDKFKPQTPDTELIRAMVGEGKKVIMSAKPLRSECSVKTLLNAAPIILKDVPDARFLIIGDGEEKDTLQTLAVSLQVADKVVFTGAVPHELLPGYLSVADVYVSTSPVDDGIAMSTAEAMACEVPPVVADCADNRLWIQDGESGFLYPPEDVLRLAEKVIFILKNPDFRKQAGAINRETIETRYNYVREMQKMEAAYAKLINRAGEHISLLPATQ